MASSVHTIERSQVVPRPLDEVFAFFADPTNLEVITPPFLRFRIATSAPVAMHRGAQIDYRLSLHGAPVRWRTLITRWEPGQRFVDVQLSGPFALWEHTHTFTEGPDGTTIRDRVDYRVPFGPIGALAHRLLVARDLHKVFDFRRDTVARLLG